MRNRKRSHKPRKLIAWPWNSSQATKNKKCLPSDMVVLDFGGHKWFFFSW
jgi:hypothetical protein